MLLLGEKPVFCLSDRMSFPLSFPPYYRYKRFSFLSSKPTFLLGSSCNPFFLCKSGAHVPRPRYIAPPPGERLSFFIVVASSLFYGSPYLTQRKMFFFQVPAFSVREKNILIFFPSFSCFFFAGPTRWGQRAFPLGGDLTGDSSPIRDSGDSFISTLPLLTAQSPSS